MTDAECEDILERIKKMGPIKSIPIGENWMIEGQDGSFMLDAQQFADLSKYVEKENYFNKPT